MKPIKPLYGLKPMQSNLIPLSNEVYKQKVESQSQMYSLFDPIFNQRGRLGINSKYHLDGDELATTFYGYLDLFKNNFDYANKPGQSFMNNLRLIGDTMDQALGATVVKSAIIADQTGRDFGDTLAKGYGLGGVGREDRDASNILNNMGMKTDGVGGWLASMAGEILLDPSTYFSLGVAGATKSVLKKGVSKLDNVSGAVIKGMSKKAGNIPDAAKVSERLAKVFMDGNKDEFIKIVISGYKSKLTATQINRLWKEGTNLVKPSSTYKLFKALEKVDDSLTKALMTMTPGGLAYRFGITKIPYYLTTVSAKSLKPIFGRDKEAQSIYDIFNNLANPDEVTRLAKEYESKMPELEQELDTLFQKSNKVATRQVEIRERLKITTDDAEKIKLYIESDQLVDEAAKLRQEIATKAVARDNIANKSNEGMYQFYALKEQLQAVIKRERTNINKNIEAAINKSEPVKADDLYSFEKIQKIIDEMNKLIDENPPLKATLYSNPTMREFLKEAKEFLERHGLKNSHFNDLMMLDKNGVWKAVTESYFKYVDKIDALDLDIEKLRNQIADLNRRLNKNIKTTKGSKGVLQYARYNKSIQDEIDLLNKQLTELTETRKLIAETKMTKDGFTTSIDLTYSQIQHAVMDIYQEYLTPKVDKINYTTLAEIQDALENGKYKTFGEFVTDAFRMDPVIAKLYKTLTSFTIHFQPSTWSEAKMMKSFDRSASMYDYLVNVLFAGGNSERKLAYWLGTKDQKGYSTLKKYVQAVKNTVIEKEIVRDGKVITVEYTDIVKLNELKKDPNLRPLFAAIAPNQKRIWTDILRKNNTEKAAIIEQLIAIQKEAIELGVKRAEEVDSSILAISNNQKIMEAIEKGQTIDPEIAKTNPMLLEYNELVNKYNYAMSRKAKVQNNTRLIKDEGVRDTKVRLAEGIDKAFNSFEDVISKAENGLGIKSDNYTYKFDPETNKLAVYSGKKKVKDLTQVEVQQLVKASEQRVKNILGTGLMSEAEQANLAKAQDVLKKEQVRYTDVVNALEHETIISLYNFVNSVSKIETIQTKSYTDIENKRLKTLPALIDKMINLSNTTHDKNKLAELKRIINKYINDRKNFTESDVYLLKDSVAKIQNFNSTGIDRINQAKKIIDNLKSKGKIAKEDYYKLVTAQKNLGAALDHYTNFDDSVKFLADELNDPDYNLANIKADIDSSKSRLDVLKNQISGIVRTDIENINQHFVNSMVGGGEYVDDLIARYNKMNRANASLEAKLANPGVSLNPDPAIAAANSGIAHNFDNPLSIDTLFPHGDKLDLSAKLDLAETLFTLLGDHNNFTQELLLIKYYLSVIDKHHSFAMTGGEALSREDMNLLIDEVIGFLEDAQHNIEQLQVEFDDPKIGRKQALKSMEERMLKLYNTNLYLRREQTKAAIGYLTNVLNVNYKDYESIRANLADKIREIIRESDDGLFIAKVSNSFHKYWSSLPIWTYMEKSGTGDKNDKIMELIREPERLKYWFEVLASHAAANPELVPFIKQIKSLFWYIVIDNNKYLKDIPINEVANKSFTSLKLPLEFREEVMRQIKDIDFNISQYVAKQSQLLDNMGQKVSAAKQIDSPFKDILDSFTDFLYAIDTTNNAYGITRNLTAKNNFKLTDPNQEYIIFDLETNGKDPGNDQPTQISLKKFKNGKVIAQDSFFVRLGPGQIIPEDIIEKTNITKEFLHGVANGKELKEALQTFVDFVGQTPLVAHNANFDYEFIITKLYQLGMYKTEMFGPVIDTYALATRLLMNETDIENFQLEGIANKLGIEFKAEDAHNADYDTLKLAEVFNALLKRDEMKQFIMASDLNKAFSNDVLSDVMMKRSMNLIAQKDIDGYISVVLTDINDKIFNTLNIVSSTGYLNKITRSTLPLHNAKHVSTKYPELNGYIKDLVESIDDMLKAISSNTASINQVLFNDKMPVNQRIDAISRRLTGLTQLKKDMIESLIETRLEKTKNYLLEQIKALRKIGDEEALKDYDLVFREVDRIEDAFKDINAIKQTLSEVNSQGIAQIKKLDGQIKILEGNKQRVSVADYKNTFMEVRNVISDLGRKNFDGSVDKYVTAKTSNDEQEFFDIVISDMPDSDNFFDWIDYLDRVEEYYLRIENKKYDEMLGIPPSDFEINLYSKDVLKPLADKNEIFRDIVYDPDNTNLFFTIRELAMSLNIELKIIEKDYIDTVTSLYGGVKGKIPLVTKELSRNYAQVLIVNDLLTSADYNKFLTLFNEDGYKTFEKGSNMYLFGQAFNEAAKIDPEHMKIRNTMNQIHNNLVFIGDLLRYAKTTGNEKRYYVIFDLLDQLDIYTKRNANLTVNELTKGITQIFEAKRKDLVKRGKDFPEYDRIVSMIEEKVRERYANGQSLIFNPSAMVTNQLYKQFKEVLDLIANVTGNGSVKNINTEQFKYYKSFQYTDIRDNFMEILGSMRRTLSYIKNENRKGRLSPFHLNNARQYTLMYEHELLEENGKYVVRPISKNSYNEDGEFVKGYIQKERELKRLMNEPLDDTFVKDNTKTVFDEASYVKDLANGGLTRADYLIQQRMVANWTNASDTKLYLVYEFLANELGIEIETFASHMQRYAKDSYRKINNIDIFNTSYSELEEPLLSLVKQLGHIKPGMQYEVLNRFKAAFIDTIQTLRYKKATPIQTQVFEAFAKKHSNLKVPDSTNLYEWSEFLNDIIYGYRDEIKKIENKELRRLSKDEALKIEQEYYKANKNLIRDATNVRRQFKLYSMKAKNPTNIMIKDLQDYSAYGFKELRGLFSNDEEFIRFLKKSNDLHLVLIDRRGGQNTITRVRTNNLSKMDLERIEQSGFLEMGFVSTNDFKVLNKKYNSPELNYVEEKLHKFLVHYPKIGMLFNLGFLMGNVVEVIIKSGFSSESIRDIPRDIRDAHHAYNLWLDTYMEASKYPELFDTHKFSSKYNWVNLVEEEKVKLKESLKKKGNLYYDDKFNSYTELEYKNLDWSFFKTDISGGYIGANGKHYTKEEYELIKKVNAFFNSPAGAGEMQEFTKNISIHGKEIGKVDTQYLSTNPVKAGIERTEAFVDKVAYSKVIAANFGLNARVEGIGRLALYFNQLKHGYSNDEALLKVLKTYFNYGDKTKAELYAEFLIPFISYPLRNYEYFMELMSTNGNAARILADALLTAWQDDDTNESDYLAYQAMRGSIPVSDDTMFTGGLGYPDAMALPATSIQTAQRKMHPLLRLGVSGLESVHQGNAELMNKSVSRFPGISQINNVAQAFESIGANEAGLSTIFPSMFNSYYQRQVYNYRRNYVPRIRPNAYLDYTWKYRPKLPRMYTNGGPHYMYTLRRGY